VDDKFYEAAIPEPWTILGLRLHPFSIGHYFILSRLGSAFFDTKVKIDIGQITMAVAVCSQTYAENLKMLDDETLFSGILKWNERLTGTDRWLVRWGLKKENKINWDEKLEMLLAYLGEIHNEPTYSETEGGNTPISLSTAQIVALTLMKHLHIPEEKLMDRPWSRCMWDFIALKAMEGQVTIYDHDALIEGQKRANELAEKFKKRKEGAPV
jgi:hypothetical protein